MQAADEFCVATPLPIREGQNFALVRMKETGMKRYAASSVVELGPLDSSALYLSAG
jgi:hypothetical protein